jgi:Domain of unknown function (DUF4224)
MSLTLSIEEIFEVTGYKRAADQAAFFAALGIPVHRRPDGSVSVCRQHYLDLVRRDDATSAPRPQLRSDHAKTTPQPRIRKTRLALVR